MVPVTHACCGTPILKIAFVRSRTKASGFLVKPWRRAASRKAIFTEYGVGVISVLPAVDVARDIFKEKSAT
jgi:hypothetical protein